MNDSNKNKTITRDLVQEVAEELMIKQKEVRTIEVINHLRSKGFMAEEQEVFSWMNRLCYPRLWTYRRRGTTRIFSFRQDTTEDLHQYFENKKLGIFWEVYVNRKTSHEIIGSIGTIGQRKEKDYTTNREAIHFSKKMMTSKLNDDFVNATDFRLKITLRLRYENALKQEPLKCELGYFDLQKLVKQSAIFKRSGQHSRGYLKVILNVAYLLKWDLPKEKKQLTHLFSKEKIKLEKLVCSELELLGAKMLSYESFDENGNSIPEFDEYLTEEAESEMIYIELNNNNIYKAVFSYADGSTLELSKFELDYQEEFLPLIKLILGREKLKK